MADFDSVVDEFIDYYQTVRGHVREVLTRENLSEFLPSTSATAIDVGGGDGRDARWLAERGYKVTLIDPSLKMIKRATIRFNKLGTNVAIHHLYPQDIAAKFKSQTFDIVLSHGVIEYCIQDPSAHLRLLRELAHPKSVISILTKGYGGGIARALFKQDSDMARDITKSEQAINSLGLRVWAFRPSSLEALLKKNNLRLLTWRGVRVGSENDFRKYSDVPSDELKQILDTERYFAKEESTRGLGQMLHYFVRKI